MSVRTRPQVTPPPPNSLWSGGTAMPWWSRALAGLSAGIVLVVLKLITASFFVGVPDSVRNVVWFTAIAMIVVTVILACFELFPNNPMGRLFWDSLTLPSVLLAVAAQSALGPMVPQSGPLPKLSLGAVHSMHATKNFVAPFAMGAFTPVGSAVVGVSSIGADELKANPFDGVLIFLGRSPNSKTFLFVVGTTADSERAFAVAANIRRIQDVIGEKAEVIQLKGSLKSKEQFIVTLGGLKTAQGAQYTKEQVRSKVVDLLLAASDKIGTETAALLLKGTVVDARSLLGSSD